MIKLSAPSKSGYTALHETPAEALADAARLLGIDETDVVTEESPDGSTTYYFPHQKALAYAIQSTPCAIRLRYYHAEGREGYTYPLESKLIIADTFDSVIAARLCVVSLLGDHGTWTDESGQLHMHESGNEGCGGFSFWWDGHDVPGGDRPVIGIAQ